MYVFFIRHAESVGNREGRMLGQCEDELTERGRQQAHRLATRLQTQHPAPTQIYTSPLRRALQTTEMLMAAADVSLADSCLHCSDDLKELHGGIFQGLTWVEAYEQHRDLCQSLETNRSWIAVPGAESPQSARDRAQRFITQLLSHHTDADVIWVITHGGLLPHLLSVVWNCDRTWGFTANHTGLFELWFDHSLWQITDQNLYNTALWQIRQFNDIAHLLF